MKLLARRRVRTWLLGVIIGWTGCVQPRANAANWPQFRGPARDGISRETGLLHKWPASGPKVLWTVPVAQGYAGAAIISEDQSG